MNRALLSIACHAYATAAIAYLIFLVRQMKFLPLVGRAAVAAGLIFHAVALAQLALGQGGMVLGLGQGFSAVAFLLLSIFLIIDLRSRMPVLGAFLVPLALAVLVPGLLLQPTSVLPASLRGPLLPIHVTIAFLGLASFGVATGIAVVYLLMERQVKTKKFGLLFSRLPPLGVLDDLNQRLVVWGFVALSITLVTGAFFSSGAEGFFWKWEPKEIATLIAWLVFGLVICARSVAGWQGKRVAMLTMAGFGALIVSFLTSYDPVYLTGLNR